MPNDFSIIGLRVTSSPAIANGQVIKRWRVEAISVFFRLRTLLKLRSRFRLSLNQKLSAIPAQLEVKRIAPEATAESLREISNLRLKKTSSNRVIFGPWTGELGMEIFYWAPWVQNVANDHDFVMSRGGTKFLYPKPSTYIDIFTHTNKEWWGNYQVDQIRTYGGEKQRIWLAYELDLIKELQKDGTLNSSERVVHPREFFKRFYSDSSRDEEMILNYVESLTIHLPKTIESHLSQQNISKSDLFNGNQVAYGVYSREGVNMAHVSTFLNSSRVREIIDNSKIYSLRTSYSDKHHLQMGEPEGISYPLMNSRRDENLLNQASLIANCQYLITTHGGLAYLGLLLGKNVIALQSSMNVWHPRHVKNAELLAKLQRVNFDVIVC